MSNGKPSILETKLTHLGTIDGRENTKSIGETEPQQKSPDHVSVSELKIWKVYYLVVLYIFLFSKVVASTACSCVGSDFWLLMIRHWLL